MSLFGKKKEAPQEEASNATVKILGGGCPKCDALEKATREALAALGKEESVGHVRDYKAIASYGVLSTPALVVKEKVVSCGQVLRPDEIATLLQRELD